MNNKCYIGPAGWLYKDWDGIVYPKSLPARTNRLTYLARYFNLVEINGSFYKPPDARTTQNWLKSVRANPDFMFTYKLWQRFTHNRASIPTQAEEELVKVGLDPILEQNKLGALLIQFPWSFKYNNRNIEWIRDVVRRFKDYYPVIEIRHDSWNTSDFIKILNENKAGFANIDQPVLNNSIPLTDTISSDVAYIRCHGRNYSNWFHEDSTAVSRYNYLYDSNELTELLKTINTLIKNSQKTYIIFNNHYRGQAVTNALQTSFLLNEQKPEIPESLPLVYPELISISGATRPGSQITLF